MIANLRNASKHDLSEINEYPANSLFDDESIRSRFHEVGPTKNQVEKIYEMAEEFLSPVLSEIFQTVHQANTLAELRKFFGSEDRMMDASEKICAFAEKFPARWRV
ncbi:MAG: hypothetical protein LBF28_03385 [Rickettsiales bacterium]|jgi:hypothetical protein|nr:hypothetical protein [Rickettsiales bacterium]